MSFSIVNPQWYLPDMEFHEIDPSINGFFWLISWGFSGISMKSWGYFMGSLEDFHKAVGITMRPRKRYGIYGESSIHEQFTEPRHCTSIAGDWWECNGNITTMGYNLRRDIYIYNGIIIRILPLRIKHGNLKSYVDGDWFSSKLFCGLPEGNWNRIYQLTNGYFH